MAQINFEEMPKLEFFPEKGILQFYILNSMAENHGQDYDDQTNQNNFRVLYHPEIDKSVTGKIALVDPEDNEFPIAEYPLALSFQQNSEPVAMTDKISWTQFFPVTVIFKIIRMPRGLRIKNILRSYFGAKVT